MRNKVISIEDKSSIARKKQILNEVLQVAAKLDFSFSVRLYALPGPVQDIGSKTEALSKYSPKELMQAVEELDKDNINAWMALDRHFYSEILKWNKEAISKKNKQVIDVNKGKKKIEVLGKELNQAFAKTDLEISRIADLYKSVPVGEIPDSQKHFLAVRFHLLANDIAIAAYNKKVQDVEVFITKQTEALSLVLKAVQMNEEAFYLFQELGKSLENIHFYLEGLIENVSVYKENQETLKPKLLELLEMLNVSVTETSMPDEDFLGFVMEAVMLKRLQFSIKDNVLTNNSEIFKKTTKDYQDIFIHNIEQLHIKVAKDLFEAGKTGIYIEHLKSLGSSEQRVNLIKPLLFDIYFEWHKDGGRENLLNFAHQLLELFQEDFKNDYALLTMFYRAQLDKNDSNGGFYINELAKLEKRLYDQMGAGKDLDLNNDTRNILIFYFTRKNYEMLAEAYLSAGNYPTAILCVNRLIAIDRVIMDHPNHLEFRDNTPLNGPEEANKSLYYDRDLINLGLNKVFLLQELLETNPSKEYQQMYQKYMKDEFIKDLTDERDEVILMQNLGFLYGKTKGNKEEQKVLNFLRDFCNNNIAKEPKLVPLYLMLETNGGKIDHVLVDKVLSLFDPKSDYKQAVALSIIKHLCRNLKHTKDDNSVQLYQIKLIHSLLDAFIEITPGKKNPRKRNAIKLRSIIESEINNIGTVLLKKSILTGLKDNQDVTTIYHERMDARIKQFHNSIKGKTRNTPKELRDKFVDLNLGLPVVKSKESINNLVKDYYKEKFKVVIDFVGEEFVLESIKDVLDINAKPENVSAKLRADLKFAFPFLPVRLTSEPFQPAAGVSSSGYESVQDKAIAYYLDVFSTKSYNKVLGLDGLKQLVKSLVENNYHEHEIRDIVREKALLHLFENKQILVAKSILDKGLADEFIDYIANKTTTAFELHLRNFVVTRYRKDTSIPTYLFNKYLNNLPKDFDVENFLQAIDTLSVIYKLLVEHSRYEFKVYGYNDYLNITNQMMDSIIQRFLDNNNSSKVFLKNLEEAEKTTDLELESMMQSHNMLRLL